MAPAHKSLYLSLVLLMASACTVKTFYNQLDWVIADRLETYVELSSEQQLALYKQLDGVLRWHKASQLPLYAQWLQAIKRDVQHGLTYAKAEQHSHRLHAHFQRLLVRAAEALSPLLPTLTAAQREELYANMAQKNREFADDHIHVSRQEQIETYTERLEDRLEDWLGSITAQQAKRIQTTAEQLQPLAGEALQTRQRWQAQFKTILENHTDIATTHQSLHDLFVNADTLRSDRYKRIMQYNRQRILQLIVAVAQSMTSAQRQYLYEKIDEYSGYFNELAEEARAAP